jgi:FMN-dependent NADH-azoreductase
VAAESLHLVAAELTRVDVLPPLAGPEDLAAVSLAAARDAVASLAAA